jgi:hypothetical protein
MPDQNDPQSSSAIGILDCLAADSLPRIYYSQNDNVPIAMTERGEIISPWVKLSFRGSNANAASNGQGGSIITVSNDSSPDTLPYKNSACITSFEHGAEAGHQVRISIQDQEGGTLATFLDHLVKDWSCTDFSFANLDCDVQYGWIRSNCSNAGRILHKSPCMTLKLMDVQSQINKGIFTTQLTLTDPMHIGQQGSTNISYGNMRIAQAIRLLWTNSFSPNVKSVGFYKMGPHGKLGCGFFEESNPDGKVGNWSCYGFDKYSTCDYWLSTNLSENKKPWKGFYNAETEEVEYWEQQGTDKDPIGFRCIGKYYVNAGNIGPVLEFNPNFKWNFAQMQTVGGAISNSAVGPFSDLAEKTKGGSATTPGINSAGLTRSSNLGAGIPVMYNDNDNFRNYYGKWGMQEAQKQQSVSVYRKLPIYAIEADLVIVGNPDLAPIVHILNATCVWIVFINPFFLAPFSNPSGLDWTVSYPAENLALTHKIWQIKEVNHKIDSGKYTTTLKLSLVWNDRPAFNSDGTPTDWINLEQNLIDGGWKPISCQDGVRI